MMGRRAPRPRPAARAQPAGLTSQALSMATATPAQTVEDALHIPKARVKRVMKADTDVKNIKPEAVVLMVRSLPMVHALECIQTCWPATILPQAPVCAAGSPAR